MSERIRVRVYLAATCDDDDDGGDDSGGRQATSSCHRRCSSHNNIRCGAIKSAVVNFDASTGRAKNSFHTCPK